MRERARTQGAVAHGTDLTMTTGTLPGRAAFRALSPARMDFTVDGRLPPPALGHGRPSVSTTLLMVEAGHDMASCDSIEARSAFDSTKSRIASFDLNTDDGAAPQPTRAGGLRASGVARGAPCAPAAGGWVVGADAPRVRLDGHWNRMESIRGLESNGINPRIRIEWNQSVSNRIVSNHSLADGNAHA